MKRRIVMQFNEDANQWEWEIEEYKGKVGWALSEVWDQIPGDEYAGQNELYSEACACAELALKYVKDFNA